MPDTSLTDSLGRKITLHDRTWHGHIVRGHPEVEGLRGLCESAIARPTEIRRSRSDEDCRLYYGPGPRSGVMIMVVADVVQGLVKTAHLCNKVSGGEAEWSRST